ncbi:PIN domain-containing protein [Breznakiellaceae bacterium SP9]
MKVLFDTNTIVDIITEREPFFKQSYDVFALAAREYIEGIVSANSITDVYYIVRRILKDAPLTLGSIKGITKAIHIVDTKVQDICEAMVSNFSDFEDAVVAAVAKRECADFIVTRNIKDFAASAVPAVTPEEFLKKWNAND